MRSTVTRPIRALGMGIGLSLSAFLASSATLPAPATAQTPPIASQETNFQNVVAEVTQCQREEGVLTIRLRFRNTGSSPIEPTLVQGGGGYEAYYVTGGSKKYFVLRDSEKTPLASPTLYGNVKPTIPANGSFIFWAKFPAPPNDVKKITLVTPVAPPFDNLPITD
jgi:hypothetical protein